MPSVELVSVSKAFHSGGALLPAVSEFSLTIDSGRHFCCLVGPSGCGKSTLLNLIAGLDTPDDGEVRIHGAPALGPGPDRVVILQEAALFPWLNVRQNVAFGLKLRGTPKAERDERVFELLRLVHLSRFAQSWVHELSGGMKQRVALARALALDPSILLMDEPFGALDAQTRDLMHEMLEELWARTRKTVVFVTHNVREAVRLGSRVIALTARPARIKRIYDIDLPRPRRLDDVELARLAAVIHDDLRDEVLETAAQEGR